MDANGFRKGQMPDFFTTQPEYSIEYQVKKVVVPTKVSAPTPDNRYPGYSAIMNDGRIITDYRPRCSQNIPAGSQYATRRWLQKNSDTIINLSRNRQADMAGAGMGYDSSIEMPAAAYVTCDEAECGYVNSNPHGLGIERKDKAAPLFGTFAQSYPISKKDTPLLTNFYEGGRNSVRGKF